MAKHIVSTLTLIVIIAAFSVAQADNDYFLGTRGEGIGFGFSALADEPFGALYNPAGPAFTQGLQTQVGYQQPTRYGLSGVDESPYGGSLGLNYYNPIYGNIVLNSHQYGSFADPTYVTTLNSIDLAFAKSFIGQIGAGVGFKYMFESNFEKRKVFDMDIGFTYRPLPEVSLAAVGKNLLRGKFTPDDVYSSHLSRKLSLAGAYNVPLSENSVSLIAAWQLEQAGEIETQNTSLFNFGTEWWLGTYSSISLGLRGGYTFGKATVADVETDYKRWNVGLSLNFDIQGQDLRIDYAARAYPFENDESLTADHFVAISYGWGGVPDYFGGKEDKGYDLTRYQDSQNWQTPSAVETGTPVEQKPPAAQPAIEQAPVVEAPEIERVPEASTPPSEPVLNVETPAAEPVPAADVPAGEPVSAMEPPAAAEEPAIESPVAEPAPVLAQNTMPEPVPAPQPLPQQVKPAEPPQPIEFTELKLNLDATQMDGIQGRRIIFSLRPDGLLTLQSWKLYVFSAKLKDWNEATIDGYAMAVIKGKGVTPLSVIWDGVLEKGGIVQPGKYYFVVVGMDKYGTHYMSDWRKFKIK
jgi:hypothetical protein